MGTSSKWINTTLIGNIGWVQINFNLQKYLYTLPEYGNWEDEDQNMRIGNKSNFQNIKDHYTKVVTCTSAKMKDSSAFCK